MSRPLIAAFQSVSKRLATDDRFKVDLEQILFVRGLAISETVIRHLNENLRRIREPELSFADTPQTDYSRIRNGAKAALRCEIRDRLLGFDGQGVLLHARAVVAALYRGQPFHPPRRTDPAPDEWRPVSPQVSPPPSPMKPERPPLSLGDGAEDEAWGERPIESSSQSSTDEAIALINEQLLSINRTLTAMSTMAAEIGHARQLPEVTVPVEMATFLEEVLTGQKSILEHLSRLDRCSPVSVPSQRWWGAAIFGRFRRRVGR